jgi:hypothetical protein
MVGWLLVHNRLRIKQREKNGKQNVISLGDIRWEFLRNDYIKVGTDVYHLCPDKEGGYRLDHVAQTGTVCKQLSSKSREALEILKACFGLLRPRQSGRPVSLVL